MSMFAAMCPKCGTMHDLFTAVDGSIVCHVDRDAKVEAEVRERLRAQVEVMRPAGFVHGDDPGNDLLRRSHVLALLGGAQ